MYWIGTSGWNYRHWRNAFYPPGVAQRHWLPYYAERLNSVEINATFYRLPPPETFARWAAAVPEGFRFAFKASRYITHVRRLRALEDALDRLLVGAAHLGPRRGPMLVQLPPNFPPDGERLDRFLGTCPAGLSVAVEFRDPRWFSEEIESILRGHGAALAWSDYPGAASPEWETAEFRYIRCHGTSSRFAGRYGPERLARLAERITAAGTDTYCYFNNDAAGAAVLDATALARLVDPPG